MRGAEPLYLVPSGRVAVAVTSIPYVPFATAFPSCTDRFVMSLSVREAGCAGFGVNTASMPAGMPEIDMVAGYGVLHDSVAFAERLNVNWHTCTVTRSPNEEPAAEEIDAFDRLTLMSTCE